MLSEFHLLKKGSEILIFLISFIKLLINMKKCRKPYISFHQIDFPIFRCIRCGFVLQINFVVLVLLIYKTLL